MHYPFFKHKELACPCCNKSEMDENFMERIIQLRIKLGWSFVVPDGGAYRCEKYEPNDSEHKLGKGIDIITNSSQRFQLVDAAIRAGFGRIGINNGSIHIGAATNTDGKAQFVMWDYYK